MCGECKKIRLLTEFKANSSKCNSCVKILDNDIRSERCYMCNALFQPDGRFNKICTTCKQGEVWGSTVLYNVEF